MNNTLTTEEQELKRQKRREANKRANDRARQVPGVHGFEILIREAYDPQAGIGTRKPDSDRSWCFLPKCYFSATALAKHVAHKESLAVTWGPLATMRVIDADAHGQADRMEALPRLWQAIQALHFGRGTLLPELTNGRVPDGVRIDGVIITSPNGLHYMERTVDTSPGDRLAQDNARVLACFAQYSVTVRPGVIEVLPSTNGQSRLPLGHGCEFVYPALGAVDIETGLEVIASLGRVSRIFPDVLYCQASVSLPTPWVPTSYEVGGVGESSLMQSEHAHPVAHENASVDFASDDERNAFLTQLDQPGYTVPKVNQRYEDAKKASRKLRASSKSKPLTSEPANKLGANGLRREGGGEESSRSEDFTSSEFVENAKSILVNGASLGNRNHEAWDLCMYLRLTSGYSREETERRMIQWIETAPHSSKDLQSGKKSTALRNLRTHLDKFDAGLASGKYYQVGDGSGGVRASSKSGDALLLCPMDNEDAFYEVGREFLQDVNGDSLLTNMPEWIKSTLPILVGAIAHYSRNGTIALPVDTVKEYARTRKSKQDPFDGVTRPAYQILINLLERFGVVSGIIRKANKLQRLAAVYETNTGTNESAKDNGGSTEDSADDADCGDQPDASRSSPGVQRLQDHEWAVPVSGEHEQRVRGFCVRGSDDADVPCSRAWLSMVGQAA